MMYEERKKALRYLMFLKEKREMGQLKPEAVQTGEVNANIL